MKQSNRLDASTPAQPRRKPQWRDIDGVLLLDKPLGPSSTQALQTARRLYSARKAGHTGTLDPLATGLLPLCFGEATKFSSFVLDAPKTYHASVRLGVTTATGDAEGAVLSRAQVDVTPQQIAAVLAGLTGTQLQTPHQYSAVKQAGRASYEYARKGISIELTPREITVYALTFVQYSAPDLDIEARCSKGTYVRVLAEQIGAALGCGAHLQALRRIGAAGFVLAQAHTLDQLQALSDAQRDALLLPLDTLVAALPRVDLDLSSAKRFMQGQRLACLGIAGKARVYEGERFLGVGEVTQDVLHPTRLVAQVLS